MRKGPLGAWSLVLMTSGWQNSLRGTALLRPLCKDLCPSLPIPGLSNSQVVCPRQGLLLVAVGNEPSLPVGISLYPGAWKGTGIRGPSHWNVEPY